MMQNEPEYLIGWNDATIHDFVSSIGEPAREIKYTLVTCIDSSFNVSALRASSSLLRNLTNDFEVIGDGLLFETKTLAKAEDRSRIFFGCDEVWFSARKDIAPKPQGLVIVGPSRIDARLLEDHAKWLADNKCALGLGDGDGLNYCVKVSGFAAQFAHTIKGLGSVASSGNLERD
jgi:hypothetical protein